MPELIIILLSSSLLGLLCTPGITSIGKIILYSSLSFYIQILGLAHFAGYYDLLFKSGIRIPLLAGSLLLFFISVLLFFRNRSFKKVISFTTCKFNFKENILTYPIILLYTDIFLNALIFYPDSYDGNAYHLPLAIKFMQSNSFSEIPRIWHYAMPSNAEAVFTFFALPGFPILLNFSQLLLLCALILWTTRFNKMYFNLNKSASTIVTTLILSMPVIFQGAFFHYIDFFGTTFLYFAITTMLLLRRTPKKTFIKLLFVSGLCYGAAIGTKLTFIVFLPVIGTLLIYAFFSRRNEFTLKTCITAILTFTAGLLLLSSFWYYRNYILFQNPFFPLDIPQLNLTGVPIENIVNKEFEKQFTGGHFFGWLLYSFSEPHSTGKYFFSFGPLFSTIIIPSFLITTAYSIVNLKKLINQRMAVFCTVIISLLMLWFLFMSRQPRFVMIVPLLMSSTSGYILKTIVSRKQMLFFTITFFSTVLLFLYSYEFITKIAFCVRHHSSPYNWYTYYKVPDPDPARIAHGVKGILNLCDEELNFALYGPYFNKSVITSQEIQNTIYGDNLLYTDRMHLPPYTSEQIDMFSKRFNGFYIFSDNDIRHSKLKLITSSSVQFPEMEWLKRYIYILGDNHSVQ